MSRSRVFDIHRRGHPPPYNPSEANDGGGCPLLWGDHLAQPGSEIRLILHLPCPIPTPRAFTSYKA